MTTLHGTLSWRNGWVCLAISAPQYTEPNWVVAHYPMIRCERQQDASEWIGRPATADNFGVRFTLWDGGPTLELPALDGKALPVVTETYPLSPPRGKGWNWERGEWRHNTTRKRRPATPPPQAAAGV